MPVFSFLECWGNLIAMLEAWAGWFRTTVELGGTLGDGESVCTYLDDELRRIPACICFENATE